jgi:hypothetical protein
MVQTGLSAPASSRTKSVLLRAPRPPIIVAPRSTHTVHLLSTIAVENAMVIGSVVSRRLIFYLWASPNTLLGLLFLTP